MLSSPFVQRDWIRAHGEDAKIYDRWRYTRFIPKSVERTMENPGLDEKRDALRSKLARYRSLPEYLLDGVGAALQRLLNPAEAKKRKTFLPLDASTQDHELFPSSWVTGGNIALITFLIGGVISVLRGSPLDWEEFKLTAWAAFAGALALVANKYNIRTFLNTFRDACVDKMLREKDIDDLSKWLDIQFALWPPLLWGALIGPLLGGALYFFWLLNHLGEEFHIGPFVTVILSCIQAVWVGYYLIPFYLNFPLRLNRYEFDLYTLDPSSSELVGRLSRLLSYAFYVTMAYIVQLTFGLSFIGVLTTEAPGPGIIVSALVWAPTIILFISGQLDLSNLITHAKWQTLNEVQAKIERLSTEQDVPDKDTLERLAKLMDYHDRIESTPNSALNFRSGLNFLNSLLLPVLAFLIGNLKDVIEFFRK
jgi:hypothetical protein